PLRTPNLRAPYEAEVTTPRPSGRPPTMIRSTPASSGIFRRQTSTKKASRSTCIRRGGIDRPGSGERHLRDARPRPMEGRVGGDGEVEVRDIDGPAIPDEFRREPERAEGPREVAGALSREPGDRPGRRDPHKGVPIVGVHVEGVAR